MEVYLNSIEMGDRIYGVDACAEYNFGKTADALTRADCALIAATLPNPDGSRRRSQALTCESANGKS